MYRSNGGSKLGRILVSVGHLATSEGIFCLFSCDTWGCFWSLGDGDRDTAKHLLHTVPINRGNGDKSLAVAQMLVINPFGRTSELP